ncbi:MULTISPECIES: STAS domain-containing protein [unclassified Streptomyces]|uniref:STAS domain-containing protein n=1 Tax=unclassified Streptomyces TaxID=2593676 RepID=UPI00403CE921
MNITTVTNGTHARITPHGAIDYHTLPGLQAAARTLPADILHLTWDLHDTPFMDIAALHLLDPTAGAPQPSTSVIGLKTQPLALLRLAAALFPAVGWQRFLPDETQPHADTALPLRTALHTPPIPHSRAAAKPAVAPMPIRPEPGAPLLDTG